METKLAQLLREVTNDCAKSTKKILDKCSKAALKGKSSIKIKCSEADYKCIHDTWDHIPCTPLVTELKNQGFHLDSDCDFGAFWHTYTLTISW